MRTLAALILLSAVACTAPFEHSGEAALVFVGQDLALAAQFELDADGRVVTRALHDDGRPFNRVAFRYDAPMNVVAEVSVSHDGGHSWTGWSEARTTFVEGLAHNAQIDVADGATHAQIRFRTDSITAVQFLAVELLDLDLDALSEVHFEQAAPLGTQVQWLAADGVAVSRASWGSRTTNCNGSHSFNRMTIHHTVSPNSDTASMPSRVRQIQAYHMDSRGWCDIGYHFLIGQDGNVYQGRVETLIGAHVGGQNTNNAGISFIGDFTSILPTTVMMNAGATIIRAISTTYGVSIDGNKILGHRDQGSTACPGNTFYPKLGDLISLAANGGGTTGPTDGTLTGAVFWGTNFSVDISDLARRLPGAAVTLSNGDTAFANSTGYYTFDVAPGTYTVTATATGYSTGSASKSVTSSTTTWGSIMLAQQATGTQKGTVTGYVFWGDTMGDYAVNVSDTSKRLAGATVTFSPGGKTATTNNSGSYSIDLDPGSYTVVASASGFVDASRPNPVTVTENSTSWGSTMVLALSQSDTEPPVIAISSPTDGAIVSSPSLTVVGSVTDASALASVTVNGDDATLSGTTFSRAVLLAEGLNTIRVSAIDAVGNAATRSVEVTYTPGGVVGTSGVTGFVFDASRGMSARLQNVLVSVVGSTAHEIVTDAAGTFYVDMAAGQVVVSVDAPGFIEWQETLTVVDGARTRVEVGLLAQQDYTGTDGPVRITFPVEGEILGQKKVRVTGTLGGSEITLVQVNGAQSATRSGSFTAGVVLTRGDNDIVAVGFDAAGNEVARHVIRVRYEPKGAFGCSSSGGEGGSALGVGLLALLLVRRRRAGRRR